ncbi:MAG: helix-turn-helix domain-containing protein [Parasphingorhabdus sp.]
MARNSEGCRSNCPINFVLETFGDKWTLLIVRDLMFKDKRTYGDFLESEEKISTNILADRLKRLEEHGIIAKSVSPQNQSSFIYSFTEKGLELLPIMLEITAWSAKHDTTTNTPSTFLEMFYSNKKEMVSTLLGKLSK